MSALMIATINVKGPDKFQQYLAETQKVAAPYGAELMFRGKFDRTLTREDKDHGLAFIIQFPSVEKINEWYGSDEY